MIYDIIVDLIRHLSVSLDFLKPYATLLGVIVLLLRQNNIKKIINRQLPKRFRDTQSNDIYDMMRDIKAIKEHLGVKEWSNTQPNGQEITPTLLYKRFFSLLQTIKIQRRKKYMEKLKSRKLWMAIFGALLPIINEEFGLGLNTETIIASVGAIVVYIAGQAHVDSKKGANNAKYQDTYESNK
jgi:hypothetical protein